jgi:hypothetical protein
VNIPLHDRADLPTDLRVQISTAVEDHHMLDRVILWGLSTTPQRLVTDVIVQDEYTHDVIVPWGDGLFLVYDST